MIVLILVAIVFLAMQSLALRKITVSNLRENLLTTSTFSGMITVFFLVWTIFAKESISLPTIIWGFAMGATFVVTIIVYYYALQTGPLSYTTFMFSASMIIPAVAGIIFWKESVKLTTILGLLLFLISFYFISISGNKSNSKVNKKWLIFCFLSWFLNGCGSITSKIQQTITGGKEYVAMMTISFAFAFVLSMVFYLLITFSTKQKTSVKNDITLIKNSLMLIFLVALGSGAGNAVVIYLTSRVPSAYLFPFVLGGLIITVTLYSRIVLKETMSRFGMIGIAIGIAAIIMLNL